jgi:hypothetical protein
MNLSPSLSVHTVDMDIAYLSSLQRRMRAMHSLYEDATATMALEHVNAVTLPGVLPIAFSLVHFVLIEDSALSFAGGPSPAFSDDWADRIALAVRDDGKHRSVEDMMGQSIGNYEAYLEFQRVVFAKTEDFLRDLDPASLEDVVIGHPYPESIASTFSARVGGESGITRSDALECWIYQHGLRHMGEIEHARALVGLGGMTS